MNKILKETENLKPFLSILIIVGTLLGLVFIQMEERRLGYELLKMTRAQRILVEEKRFKEMQFAKLTRPQQVEKLATAKFTLKKINTNQIIYLSGGEPVFESEPERRGSR